MVLGIGVKNETAPGATLCFRDDNDEVITGLHALIGDTLYVVEGETTATIEAGSTFSLERHFDHRVRLEIESQMGHPATVAWTTNGQQKISHIIATFPITTKTTTGVKLDSEGVATQEVNYETQSLVGDITWRRAEDKVSERYLLNDSKFFHNIRLEVFCVRKEWFQATQEYIFSKEKMPFDQGESWTAKLRFRSV